MDTPSEHTAGKPAAPSQAITVHLQHIPLLSGLDSALLRQIGMAMHYRKVDKGNYVLHKGSTGEHLVFLLAGRLRVVDLTEDGRELGLSLLAPGEYFGELSIIDGMPRSASVVAMENSLIALLPAAQATQLIYTHPLIAERVMKRLALTIRKAASHRSILGLPNAHQRVYALLAELMKIMPSGLAVIENVPTQQDISIMINTSRETVSRALNALIQNGVVEKDLRRLIVRLPEQLKAMILEPERALREHLVPGAPCSKITIDANASDRRNNLP
jgi:CRP/FNR family transcriptional regulator, cyclic AMP receptor protein